MTNSPTAARARVAVPAETGGTGVVGAVSRGAFLAPSRLRSVGADKPWVAVERAEESLTCPGKTRLARRGGAEVPMRGVKMRERRMKRDKGIRKDLRGRKTRRRDREGRTSSVSAR